MPMNDRCTRTIIVMAKAPIPGYAKSRLTPVLGANGAAVLAEQLLVHAVEQAMAAGFDAVELCVAPDDSHPAFRRLQARHNLQVTGQGSGDLGQRMHRALERALGRHGRALLIGTDSPAVDAAVLQQAARALDDADAVFVPAHDGGYALVGLNRSVNRCARRGDDRNADRMTHPLFHDIAWSTSQVMHQTRERARVAGLKLAELSPVSDIDEGADLAHLPPWWPA